MRLIITKRMLLMIILMYMTMYNKAGVAAIMYILGLQLKATCEVQNSQCQWPGLVYGIIVCGLFWYVSQCTRDSLADCARTRK